MSNAVNNVVTYLSDCIKEVIPTLKESPNTYDLEKNTANDKYVFAVRPLGGGSISGPPKTMTVSQPFEIEIQKEFSNVSATDKHLKEAIAKIFDDHEAIFKRISLRNANDIRIMLIGDFSFGSPDINYNKKTVSITYTHNIQYRNYIREGV